jgi:hypothetical protein
MYARLIIALIVGMVGTAFAFADEPMRAQNWSLGGAALATTDSSRVTVWSNTDGVSAGVGAANGSLGKSTIGGGMQTGGFLAWQSSIYRIDATLSPSFEGQMTAGLGASLGAPAGENGTRYGLRIGTAWAPSERFTINPASGLGLSELQAPYSNVNVSLSVNHALTPNLNLIGLAEAHRNFGVSPIESSSGFGRLVVGAGLGYKF